MGNPQGHSTERPRLNTLELRLLTSLWLKKLYGRPDLQGTKN